MLWVIEPDGKLSAEYNKDMERLRSNKTVRKNLDNTETSLSLAAAKTAPATALGQAEPLYVLAHAGLEPKPWLAGLTFADFAELVAEKFTTVKQRDVFLLMCTVGSKIGDLSAALKTSFTNVRLFVPNGLMYISSAGIPHVFNAGTKADWADEQVAKHNAVYSDIPKSLACGESWSGVSYNGSNPQPLDAKTVHAAVAGHFDPQGRES
jgi:hypothetical protein